MQVKKAYVADLKALHAECGSNYLRLTRILGKAEAGDSFAFPLAGNQGHFGTLLLEVVECAPYTTMVTVAQTGVLDHILDVYAARHDSASIGIEDWVATEYDPQAIKQSYKRKRGLA